MATTVLDSHIERATAGFDDHDADAFFAEFAEECRFLDPPQEDDLQRVEIRDDMAGAMEAFPDVRWEFDREHAMTDGRGKTAMEWTYYATHEADYDGIPATGESCALEGVTVIEVSGDGITSWRNYWDQQGLAEQLGLA
jgi:steroid delta-isomerase-like uncharacterized protein